MSSLVCNATHCVFTRIDTNGTALGWNPDKDLWNNGTELMDETAAPWTDLLNQDTISESVSLTRDFTGNLFNAKVPSDQYNYVAPSNTEWALLPEGKTFAEARCGMSFCAWNDCFAFYNPVGMIGKPGVVHLIQEDVYYNIVFTNWTNDYGACPGGYCPYPYPLATRDGTSSTNASAAPAVYYDGTTATAETTGSAADSSSFVPSVSVEAPISEVSTDSSFARYPPYPIPYPTPGYTGWGGGFSYVRDKSPISFNSGQKCPSCGKAKASPAILTGPIDGSFVTVSIEGITPKNITTTIKAVAQDQHPKCNIPRLISGSSNSANQIRPNARIASDKSSVSLRRTLIAGELNPFRYTIYFDATSKAGTCSGSVSVCVPPPGFTCDTYMGYDATATSYCT
jgi:hypothetical protein